MRTVGCEVFPVRNPTPAIGGPVWTFVRIDTDEGVVGYGEVDSSPLYLPPLLVAEVVRSLVNDFVVGRRVRDIEAANFAVANSHFSRSTDLLKAAAFSAIDMALWDIAGKSVGLPVYDLWGGRMRDSVRTYTYLLPPDEYAGRPQEFWSDHAAVAARAREYVEAGFTALKVDPLPRLTGGDSLASQYVPVQLTPAVIDDAVGMLGAIREAVGSRADVIVGTHGQMTAAGAIAFAREIEPIKPMWFEEPVPPALPDEMARVRQETSLPIAAGERVASLPELGALVSRDAVDILNFDVSQTGLLMARKASAVAEASLRQVSPHVYGGPIVAAASLQLSASLPNLLILEGNDRYTGGHAELLKQPITWRDGRIELSDRPGLGYELDEDAARAHRVREEDSFQYRRPRMHW